MDQPEYEWELDETTNTIMAMTTTVVRTYIHLGCVHKETAPIVPPVVPLAPEDFPRAFLGQPLGLWDFPHEPLPDFQMEPMCLGLPPVKPQPVVPVKEISSTTILGPQLPRRHFRNIIRVMTHLLRRIHPKSNLR